MTTAMIAMCIAEATVVLTGGLMLASTSGWSASARHRALLLAVWVALLLPMVSAIAATAGWGVLAPRVVAVAVPPETSESSDIAIDSSMLAPPIATAAASPRPQGPPDRGAAAPGPASANWSWGDLLPWMARVWLILSLAMVARLLVHVARGVALWRRTRPMDDVYLSSLLEQVADDRRAGRDIQLRASDEIAAPAMWCWWRPCVILPSRGAVDGIDWRAVFTHEIAHFARRDHLATLLAEALVCAAPWHPLAWHARRRLAALSEEACDDWALRCAQGPVQYAESLLTFCVRRRGNVLAPAIASSPGVASRVARVLSARRCDTRIGAGLAIGGPLIAALALVAAAIGRPTDRVAAAVSASAAPQRLVRVSVRTPHGVASSFEVALIAAHRRLPTTLRWTASASDGTAVIDAAATGGPIDAVGACLVVARGDFGWAIAPVPASGDAKLELEVGEPRAIEIRLRPATGRPLPVDLAPIVYVEETAAAAWMRHVQDRDRLASEPEREFSLTSLRPVGAASSDGSHAFRFAVPADTPRFWLLIDRPGFLRATALGPIDFAGQDDEDDIVEIQLPEPAHLTVDAAPDEGWPATYGATGVALTVAVPETATPGAMWSIPIATADAGGTASRTTFDDLPPTTMFVGVSTLDEPGPFTPDPIGRVRGRHSDGAKIALAPGQHETMSAHLRGWDEGHIRDTIARHGRTLRITVLDADGNPAVGRCVAMTYMLDPLGFRMRSMKGPEQFVGETGIVKFPQAPTSDVATILLDVAGTSDIVSLDPNAPPVVEHTVSLAPVIARPVPDITLTKVDNGHPFGLSNLRGRVVLLEFWATWCGPCQPAMTHTDEMAKRRTDWTDRVMVVGVSTDDDLDKVQAHVAKRGWNAALQAWSGPHVNGGSSASRAFGVKGIPAAFLIDGDGTLRWAGHPGDVDLEAEIDRLVDALK